jgi:uncharacterized protein
MAERMTIAALRTAATTASGLDASFEGGTEGTLSALRRLGSVQIDTISVVERAHHHILWSRNPEFQARHIPELESEPRRAIEYWSHAAAYLPIEDYRFCLPRMARVRATGHEWFKAEPAAIAYVRDRIRAEGPLRAQDFAESMKGKRGWWDWKPAKIALEYLFHAGELVSLTRRGFQKIYDLAERALPGSLDLSFPSSAEMAARYVDQARSSLGVFEEGDIAYMRKDCLDGIHSELEARLESGALVGVDIVDLPAPSRRGGLRHFYASRETLRHAAKAGQRREPRALILSPFDPLILDRKRTARIFGREFQLECYLPKSKRSFGYFALPLLYIGGSGDAGIIGLLDAKADRRGSTLIARRLTLDPHPDGRVVVARAVAAALREFAAFNRARKVELQAFESSDGRMERSLRAAVASR